MRELNRIVVRVGNPYSPSVKRNILKSIGNFFSGNPSSGSVIGAGISAIGNGISTAMTNKSNERMQRETNEQNYRIHQEQLAAARKQYEDEVAENRFLTQQARDWQLADTQSDREYNSAKAQVQRFREAGLNPALAMYGGAGSVASQSSPPPQGSNPSGSVPDAPQMQASRNIPMNFDQLGTGISAAMGQLLQQSQHSTDAALRRQELATQKDLAVAQIRKYGKDNEYTQSLIDDLERRGKWFDQQAQSEIELNDAIKRYHEAEAEYVKLQGRIQDDLAKSTIKVNNANIHLTQKQIDEITKVIEKVDAEIEDIAHTQKLSDKELSLKRYDLTMKYLYASKDLQLRDRIANHEENHDIIRDVLDASKDGLMMYYLLRGTGRPGVSVPNPRVFRAGRAYRSIINGVKKGNKVSYD